VLVGRDLYLEDRFPALYPIGIFQMRGFDPNTVNECTVGRTEITKESLWWGDLNYAMMAREIAVMRKTKVRVLASSDHECIMLVKGEHASGLRTRDDVQCYAHQ